MNHYETLGVSKDAPLTEIRAAFRRIAQATHPDRQSETSDVEKYRAACEAFEVLKDAKRREQYDQYGFDLHSLRPQAEALIDQVVASQMSAGPFGSIAAETLAGVLCKAQLKIRAQRDDAAELGRLCKNRFESVNNRATAAALERIYTAAVDGVRRIDQQLKVYDYALQLLDEGAKHAKD